MQGKYAPVMKESAASSKKKPATASQAQGTRTSHVGVGGGSAANRGAGSPKHAPVNYNSAAASGATRKTLGAAAGHSNR